MGQAYDEVLHLKEFRHSTRDHTRALASGGADGGAILSLLSVAISDGTMDLSPSLPVLDAFYSLIASSLLPDPADTVSFSITEADVFSLALRVSSPPLFSPSRAFDLSKPPSSYSEAIARSDAPVWRAAMDRE